MKKLLVILFTVAFVFVVLGAANAALLATFGPRQSSYDIQNLPEPPLTIENVGPFWVIVISRTMPFPDNPEYSLWDPRWDGDSSPPHPSPAQYITADDIGTLFFAEQTDDPNNGWIPFIGRLTDGINDLFSLGIHNPESGGVQSWYESQELQWQNGYQSLNGVDLGGYIITDIVVQVNSLNITDPEYNPDTGGYIAYVEHSETLFIYGYLPPPPDLVSIDIIPKTCPNECPIKGGGSIEVAIHGTVDLDVNDIDIASVRLEGVPPTRSSLKDKSSPVVDPQTACDCTTDGRDGSLDLCLKFDKKAIINALGGVNVDQEFLLTLSGELNDGTSIEGQDCIVFVPKGKKD
jgi:hypothetical protein